MRVQSLDRLLSLVLLAALAAFPGCATQRSTAATHDWVTVWGASSVGAVPTGQAFDNQTLRLIVHPSIGGDQLRVRIANTFATQALEIGGASVALQESDAMVVTETNRALTFAGRTTVSIPPGALIVSDPITLSVPSQRNLAVSLFLPKNSGPATAHPGANQNSYVSSAGNFVASNDIAAYTTTTPSWPFLVGVEARGNGPARAIVTFGDSITDGFKSTVNANRRWPDYLSARLQAAGEKIAVVNQGISGNRILHDSGMGQPRFGPNALSRFDRDVLSVSGASHVVILIGINDIGMGSATRSPAEAVSADEIIAGLKQLALRAHARGLKVIGATLTPFAQAAYFTEEGETKRQAVNKWIRTTAEYDRVIDFDAAVRDPANPRQLQPAYDSGDHLHPNDAGYKAMADSIDLGVFH
jgi:lysophospholipase L1-like esterase